MLNLIRYDFWRLRTNSQTFDIQCSLSVYVRMIENPYSRRFLFFLLAFDILQNMTDFSELSDCLLSIFICLCNNWAFVVIKDEEYFYCCGRFVVVVEKVLFSQHYYLYNITALFSCPWSWLLQRFFFIIFFVVKKFNNTRRNTTVQYIHFCELLFEFYMDIYDTICSDNVCFAQFFFIYTEFKTFETIY